MNKFLTNLDEALIMTCWHKTQATLRLVVWIERELARNSLEDGLGPFLVLLFLTVTITPQLNCSWSLPNHDKDKNIISNYWHHPFFISSFLFSFPLFPPCLTQLSLVHGIFLSMFINTRNHDSIVQITQWNCDSIFFFDFVATPRNHSFFVLQNLSLWFYCALFYQPPLIQHLTNATKVCFYCALWGRILLEI